MEKISEIQGLRGLAILMVALFHFMVRWDGRTTGGASLYPWTDVPEPFHSLLSQGRLGVELFFLISGFVIFLTLERSRNFADFWRKRFSRIWPPLVVCLPLIWLVLNVSPSLPGASPTIQSLLWSFTLVNPTLLPGSSQVSGVLWTLWVELCFYGIASTLFFRSRRFLLNLGVVGIFSTVIFVISHTSIGSAPLGFLMASLNVISYIWWFIGGTVAYSLRNNKRNLPLWLAYGISFFLTTVTLGVVVKDPVQGFIIDPTSIWAVVTNFILFTLFALVVVFKRKGALANPFAVLLGNISYEFYLIHEAVGLCMLQLIREHSEISNPALSLVPLILLTVASWLIWKFWSQKSCRWTRLRLDAISTP